jgi:hypothetical protein
MAGHIVIAAIKKNFRIQEISSSQEWFLDCFSFLWRYSPQLGLGLSP